MIRRWLWLLVPALAVFELCAYLVFANRAPDPDAWQQIREPIARLRQPGDAVVVTPRWAEPLARQALGDRLWPIVDAARPDYQGASRALVVSILNETVPRLESWPISDERRHGPFLISVRTNPAYRPALFRMTDAIASGQAEVYRRHEGTRYDCRWKRGAVARTGGLHGHVAFPRERYECGGSELEFVGVTIIDDQEYRPRRCVWAHPPEQGALWLSFADVPLGTTLRGHAGSSYFLMRDGAGPPVILEAFVDDQPVGRLEHRDEWGWAAFAFSTRQQKGSRAHLAFRIQSAEFTNRHFCFTVESV